MENTGIMKHWHSDDLETAAMLYVPGARPCMQLSDCTMKLLNRPLGNVFSEHIIQLWMVIQNKLASGVLGY